LSYDKNKIRFQTYSWGFGTTSFRVSELKYKVEKQLSILEEFRGKKDWSDFQEEYFYYLVDEELSKASANNKCKDARQKTSSLKDIGLVNKERFLQNTAKELLRIIREQDFNTNNIFGIKNDSFFYLKQFLKIEFSENIGNSSYNSFKVNPFISVIYTLLKNNNKLSKDFFTYILPTIKDYQDLEETLESFESDVNAYLLTKISSMENYQNALEYFRSSEKTEQLFKEDNIFMNMNGGNYDVKYLKFYKLLNTYKFDDSLEKKLKFLKVLEYPDNTKKKVYYKLLFNLEKKPSQKELNKDLIEKFENSFLFTHTDDFDTNYFYMIHLEKWIRNLEEYYDLNKRFLELTDVFIFEKDELCLDEVAYYIFKEKEEKLLTIALSKSKKEYFKKLYENLEITEISEVFKFDEKLLLKKLKDKYEEIDTDENLTLEVKKVRKKYQKENFNKLIDKHFSSKNIITLLENIKDRKNDIFVKNYLDWDADVPTIFEYLLGLVWYEISDRQGYLQDFLNLSLDAKLLPRRFAGGGQADIVFKYKDYDLLLEATLSNKDNQRKMELEPVSRHLGRHILNERDGYAVFVAPYLDPNVLVGFRSYKNLKYYDKNDTNKYIDGLKIIPLSIDDVICILDKKLKYNELKESFDKVYDSIELDGFKWYHKELFPKLREL